MTPGATGGKETTEEEPRKSGLPPAGRITEGLKPKRRIRANKTQLAADLENAQEKLKEAEGRLAALQAAPDLSPDVFAPAWAAIGNISTRLSGVDFRLTEAEAESLSKSTGPVVERYFGALSAGHPELMGLALAVTLIAGDKISKHSAKVAAEQAAEEEKPLAKPEQRGPYSDPKSEREPVNAETG